MGKYGEKAKALFISGYNCTQAVVLAFADELDIDTTTLLKLSSSFGAGMGRMREVCGTVSAMFIVAGLKFGYATPGDMKVKSEHYKHIQELAASFKALHGTIICRELLSGITSDTSPIPEARTPEYYKKRPCAELASDAADIIGDYIEKQNSLKLSRERIIHKTMNNIPNEKKLL